MHDAELQPLMWLLFRNSTVWGKLAYILSNIIPVHFVPKWWRLTGFSYGSNSFLEGQSSAIQSDHSGYGLTWLTMQFFNLDMGVGRIFSRGGAVRDFPKIFSRGGPKVVKFGFYPSKLKKQPFFANSFKIQGGQGPPLPPLPTPMDMGNR